MALTADEQKALDHIALERLREAFQRSLQAKLVAPAEPAGTVKRGWAPLTVKGRIPGQSG